ncbi:hypothetical protein VCHC37A1_3161A, partial [Vibrio cholerae HC-37A1]
MLVKSAVKIISTGQ